MQQKTKSNIPIIVGLNVPYQPEGYLNQSEIETQRKAIARAQDDLLDKLSGYEVTSIKRFSYIPYIAMQVDESALEYLNSLPEVKSVKRDELSGIN